MKRWYVAGTMCGVAAGLIAFAFGVQGWRPILIGVVVAALVAWAPRHWPEGTYLRWPATGARVYGGGSHQVSRLARSIGQHRRGMPEAAPGLQHRLRRLATARLARHGVGWDDPRAAELLGDDVHATLAAETLRPDPRRLDAVVAAIERLGAGPGELSARTPGGPDDPPSPGQPADPGRPSGPGRSGGPG